MSIEKLKQLIAGAKVSKGGRRAYTPEIKRALVDAKKGGLSWSQVESLGVSAASVHNWMHGNGNSHHAAKASAAKVSRLHDPSTQPNAQPTVAISIPGGYQISCQLSDLRRTIAALQA